MSNSQDVWADPCLQPYEEENKFTFFFFFFNKSWMNTIVPFACLPKEVNSLCGMLNLRTMLDNSPQKQLRPTVTEAYQQCVKFPTHVSLWYVSNTACSAGRGSNTGDKALTHYLDVVKNEWLQIEFKRC